LHRNPRGVAAITFTRTTLTAVTAAGLLLSSAVAPVAAAEGDPTELHATVGSILTLPEDDGFNDTALLTVTSDAAATVQPVILDHTDAPLALPELDEVILADADLDGVFSGTLTLSALGLAAGEYSVQVTETTLTDLSTTAPLVIGSGTAVEVTLAATDTFYPYKDDYLDTLKAKVQAYDETETAVPYSGYVSFTAGGVTRKATISSTTGANASALVSVASMALGTGTLLAKVHGNAGANTTVTKPISLLATKLAGVALSKNISTVYPSVDGYQDTVGFTYSATTAGPEYLKATGKVTVSLNGKTVKSWDLVSSKTRTFTWNGLNGGKIVPGKYTVKVSGKGPQGSTSTATIYVNVSSKKLVTKTLTQTLDAGDVYLDFGSYGMDGSCENLSTGKVSCESAEADEDGLALVAVGSTRVPTAVRGAYSASVRVTANVDRLDGPAVLSYYYDGVDGVIDTLYLGNTTLDWMRLETGLEDVYIDFWLADYTSIVVDYYKVEYRYKVLV
jgi:hypothetical protein